MRVLAALPGMEGKGTDKPVRPEAWCAASSEGTDSPARHGGQGIDSPMRCGDK